MTSLRELNIPLPLQHLFSESLRRTLLTLRQDLHRYPELSFREEKTAARLHDELAKLHTKSVDCVAKTGVVARIKGKNSKAPLVAVRGDIDALPLDEKTNLDYASTNPGVMHACGHDVHAAWTIGAAHLLSADPPEGDVIIVLQPAEEIGKGALAILESGALNDASAIFGAHVDRRYPVGHVIAQEGPLAASADTFEILLHGKGAHGARPHESLDPIVGAAALVSALQTIVSRRINPATTAVVSVGMLNAGSAPNIIPDTARLAGTLRAIDDVTRRFLHEEVKRIATALASAYGLEAETRVDEGTPPINNPPQAAGWARQAVSSLLGREAIVPLQSLNMAGEDFAFYLQKMTGCFLRIGAREEGGETIPAHSSHFYAAEESIFVGAAVLAQTARVASASLAAEAAQGSAA